MACDPKNYLFNAVYEINNPVRPDPLLTKHFELYSTTWGGGPVKREFY